MLSTEEWRDIPGYEGSYQISDRGQVRSLDRYVNRLNHGKASKQFCKGKILKQDIDEDGYCRINLRVNQLDRRFGVHRLVASAFIENLNNLPQVNHIDGDKTNNCVENLEWCTAEYNNHHAINIGHRPSSIFKNVGKSAKRRLSKPVRCVETGQEFYSMIEAERQMGLGSTSVYYSICNNRATRQGYTFELVQ